MIETGKPIPRVADELGVHAGTLQLGLALAPEQVGIRRSARARGCRRADAGK
ncbi:hypothetical protein ABZ826_37675 [Streptomyces sp. NPDC047515]|uniref:hypothetical protein n=1 Tax=Streptomyces sp. NPDC047515 TaxID=3155380 RepID=UPI0033D9DDF9